MYKNLQIWKFQCTKTSNFNTEELQYLKMSEFLSWSFILWKVINLVASISESLKNGNFNLRFNLQFFFELIKTWFLIIINFTSLVPRTKWLVPHLWQLFFATWSLLLSYMPLTLQMKLEQVLSLRAKLSDVGLQPIKKIFSTSKLIKMNKF